MQDWALHLLLQMKSFITKHALLLLLLHGAKQEDREAGRQREGKEEGKCGRRRGVGGREKGRKREKAAACCLVALLSTWVKSPPKAIFFLK